MEQQLLFPELDPYKTKIKDVDYVDVSKIKCGELKKIPYKFVHVIWIDIVSDSAWRSIDEVKESKCPRCLSTGFLIEDDDEVIRLVSDFNFNEDGSIDDCGNSTIIPKCVVQEVTEVK